MRDIEKELIFTVGFIFILLLGTLAFRGKVVERQYNAERCAVQEVKRFVDDDAQCDILSTEIIKVEGNKYTFKVITDVGDFYAIGNVNTSDWNVREVYK